MNVPAEGPSIAATGRSAEAIAVLRAACAATSRQVQIMEVCGTHTVAIFRHGLRALLPGNLHLVSGPGCPVCVTAQRHIDAALEIAAKPRVILATYGDMLRVPGRTGSLERLRARGADVRVVNSARTALDLATANPGRQVVFLAVGFETTAPATAVLVLETEQRGIENLSVLMCHKRVVPALLALLDGARAPSRAATGRERSAGDAKSGDSTIDGFLAPGHVSVIIGARAYEPVAALHRRPLVVVGFEPSAILLGLARLVRLVDTRTATVENFYPAAVSDDGNAVAQALLQRVFVTADATWRELGIIRDSGFELTPAFAHFDALQRFGVALGEDEVNPACRCGEVITGRANPSQCGAFRTACTPLNPIGPCMVSSEGTCAAWYKYAGREQRE